MHYADSKAAELMSLTGRKLVGACRSEVRHLKASHTLATAKLYLSKIRSAIRQTDPAHRALQHLILEREDYQILNADKERGNYADITQLRPISPTRVIRKGRELCMSSHPAELAIGLMLLSGRRGFEIVRGGMFRPCLPEEIADWESQVGYKLTRPEQHVWFTGQAKVRGDPDRVATGYPIPLLCPINEFLDDWNRLQGICGFWKTGNFNEQTANLFRQVTQRSFGEPGGAAWSPKDLRAAYAEIAYALFSPERRRAKVLSYEAYFAQILGHREGRIVGGQLVRDIRTAQSYKDFTLVWDEGTEQADSSQAV